MGLLVARQISIAGSILGGGLGGQGLSAAAPFSVLQLSGLQAWWRADLGITLDGSSNVQSWADQSGNGVTLSQATAGNRPAYTASDVKVGNKPTVAVATSKSIAGTLTVSQPSTIYLVGYNSTDNFDIFGGGTSHQDFGRNVSGFYITAGATLNIAGGAHDSNAHAFCGNFNSTSSKIYVDASGSPTTGDAGTQALTGPTVSVFPCAAGGVAELIICSGTHSGATVGQVFRYFAAEYGLSAS